MPSSIDSGMKPFVASACARYCINVQSSDGPGARPRRCFPGKLRLPRACGRAGPTAQEDETLRVVRRAPETLHPALWLGHQLGRSGAHVVASGFPDARCAVARRRLAAPGVERIAVAASGSGRDPPARARARRGAARRSPGDGLRSTGRPVGLGADAARFRRRAAPHRQHARSRDSRQRQPLGARAGIEERPCRRGAGVAAGAPARGASASPADRRPQPTTAWPSCCASSPLRRGRQHRRFGFRFTQAVPMPCACAS